MNMTNTRDSADSKPFFTDIKTLRKRARSHMMDGAVTKSYEGNTELACKVLNEALATEIVCVLRYKRHYFMAKGIHSGPVKAEFLQHAGEEQDHADRIAERIVQLGGSPNFSPEDLLSRSHSEYAEGTTLRSMIEEDLVAERVAIESYREIAAWFASFDTTSRRLIEEILAVEEEHADDLAELLDQFPAEHDAR
jgi:bacterioferritin